jgi:hypothetical protein
VGGAVHLEGDLLHKESLRLFFGECRCGGTVCHRVLSRGYVKASRGIVHGFVRGSPKSLIRRGGSDFRLLAMEYLTFCEHWPSTSLRPAKVLRLERFSMQCGLLGAKLEIPVHGPAFFLVTQPDMGDAVA